jgi:hypothetical protein
MIRQAIETTFYGPTNTKGARVKARCDAKTMWVNWDHSMGIEHNHHVAAASLAETLGWVDADTTLVGGTLPGKGYAWVIRG